VKAAGETATVIKGENSRSILEFMYLAFFQLVGLLFGEAIA